MKETIRPYSRSDIDFYVQLVETEKCLFAEPQAEGEVLISEINKLNHEAKRIGELPTPNEEFARELTKTAKESENKCFENTLHFIVRNRSNPRAIRSPRFAETLQKYPYFPPGMLEKIIEALPADSADAISETERAKALKKIATEKNKILKRLREIDLDGMYLLGNAVVRDHAPSNLTAVWRTVQGKCDAPCTARGIDLRTAPEYEKKAYSVLGIQKFINHKSRFTPHPG